jgi:hypothetical protein
LALAFLLCLGFAGTAWAAEAQTADEPQVTEEASAETGEQTFVPVTFAGMQVFVDQETGRLRPPTAEEARELAQRMRQHLGQNKAAAYEPQVQKDGTMSVVVGTDHLNFTVAVVDENGELHTDCVNGQHAAEEAVAAGTPRIATPQSQEVQ